MSRLRLRLAVIAAGLIALASAGGANAASSELFFSEYAEGSSFNKAVEIYNGTAAPVTLTDAYSVTVHSNGNPAVNQTIDLVGVIAPGDVFVLAHSSADPALLAVADQTTGSGLWNGDDAVALWNGTSSIDVIGQIGFDPGTEWGTGLVSTADNTIRRKPSVTAGDPNGVDAFDPAAEWDGFANNTWSGFGEHTTDGGGDAAPSVSSTTPANGAAGVAREANVSITFSEPVNVAGAWFTIACASGPRTATVTGGPTTYTLDPATNFAGNESCTVTVAAANVTDVDAEDPPDGMAADHAFTFRTVDTSVCGDPATPISTIQGSGAATPLAGETRTIEGVVVGDHEGASPALRGFYVQDAGDGDPATSDGIFVFNGGNQNLVATGDVVRVSGTVGENQGQTQVSTSAARITVCGTGSVGPTDVLLPVAAPDALERYEGMLVRTPQTLYVTEHFQLGRFGQVVLSSGDRLYQPTTLVAPGPAAVALQEQNNLNRLILDDSSQFQNPDPIVWARNGMPLSASNTLRGGDTVTGAVGVLTYTWAGNSASGNAYRLRPLNALGGSATFVAANPRPTEPLELDGRLRVAGMNVLNFFNTFGDDCTGGVTGEPMECRGADDAFEFERQWVKTVAGILGTGADIVGLGEIENDGYGPTSAIQFLVDRLNDATAPGTWAFIDADAGTGQVDALGDDAIKVGLLYKPAKVTPVGQTAALNSTEFVTGGDSDPRNRPALAQAFRENATGSLLVVSPNHLKSKGSACDTPDQGDGQGNCAGVRTAAAILLAEWLASDPTGTGTDNVLIVGDLNSYAKEDPIAALEARGYTNLVAAHLGEEAYSYVFDGQWGYLDTALGSTALTPQVVDVAEWHINADEPSVLDYNDDFKSAGQVASLYAPDWFRMSDHDPVVVGLDLRVTFAGVCTLVREHVSKPGIADALCAKLAAAAAAAERGNENAKAGVLGAFVNHLEAQSGKSLTADAAEALAALAAQL